jgi:hypothetical protein
MKTEDLIRALAADAEAKVVPLGRALILGLLPALAISGLLYSFMLAPRPHLLALIAEPRIMFKLGFPLALAGCAGVTLLRLVRPCSDLRLCLAMLAVLALALAAAVVSELVLVPHALWRASMMGHYALACSVCIPLLSAAPLVAAFIVMRQGAPTHPALAGAGVGFLASAIGAAIYATHCPDDSPLFLATWYVLAIACVTALGAIAGTRVLRW